MSMEIKITTSDMLKVLVHAGIEANDAKAIIFDLLQYPEGGIPERKKLKDAKKTRLRKKRTAKSGGEDDTRINSAVSEDDADDTQDDDGEEDDEDRSVKRPRRISFKNFGGISPPLKV